MATFYVSAWFDIDIDVSGDPESDEYRQAIDEIKKKIEGYHALLLTTSYDTYLSHKIEADYLD